MDARATPTLFLHGVPSQSYSFVPVCGHSFHYHKSADHCCTATHVADEMHCAMHASRLLVHGLVHRS